MPTQIEISINDALKQLILKVDALLTKVETLNDHLSSIAESQDILSGKHNAARGIV